MKRYNLVLPEGLFELVQRFAEDNGLTVAETIRKFIRIGLMVTDSFSEVTLVAGYRTKEEKEIRLVV